MKEQTRMILMIVLCAVIVVCLAVGFAAIRLRHSTKPNPNATWITTPDQTGFEAHPQWGGTDVQPSRGDNLALGKPVTDNGHTDVYRCSHVTDGDRQTYWEGSANLPNELTVDLEAVTAIGGVEILLNPDAVWGARTQELELQISTDGETFTALGSKTAETFDPATGNSVYVAFTDAPPEARYVRFVFHSNTGAAGGQAAEIAVYAP